MVNTQQTADNTNENELQIDNFLFEHLGTTKTDSTSIEIQSTQSNTTSNLHETRKIVSNNLHIISLNFMYLDYANQESIIHFESSRIHFVFEKAVDCVDDCNV